MDSGRNRSVAIAARRFTQPRASKSPTPPSSASIAKNLFPMPIPPVLCGYGADAQLWKLVNTTLPLTGCAKFLNIESQSFADSICQIGPPRFLFNPPEAPSSTDPELRISRTLCGAATHAISSVWHSLCVRRKQRSAPRSVVVANSRVPYGIEETIRQDPWA